MKQIQILGWAAIAFVVATALIGVSSASAVTLCKVEGLEECNANNRYGLPQPFKATAEGSISTYDSGLIENNCFNSEIKGKFTTNDGKEAGLLGLIETLTFSLCGQCIEEKAENLPWKVTLLGHGDMHFMNHGSGNPALLLKCKLITGNTVACLYELKEGLMSVLGGDVNGTLALIGVDQVFSVTGNDSGMTCLTMGNIVLKGGYIATEPDPWFVSLRP